MARRLGRDSGYFDFDDVRLVPGLCRVASRSEINVSTTFGPHAFRLPIVPANMSAVMDEKLAHWFASNGYFYIMHRFDVDNVELVRRLKAEGLLTSISVGVQSVDYALVDQLEEEGLAPDYITIDIAHGHAPTVASMIRHIASHLPSTFIIAGNVATREGARYLEEAGAHAIKVGVGPGMACTTSPNTGFGTRGWQLAAVEEAASGVERALIIADGGIRTDGDIAKAVAFGADMVMIGGIFAGHDESPGERVVNPDGTLSAVFYGSASEHQKKGNNHVEGKKLLVPTKGPMAATLKRVEQNLQSAVSYVGGVQLSDLTHAEYVLVG